MTAQVLTLTEFLLARYDEDEAVAQGLASERDAEPAWYAIPGFYYDYVHLDTYTDGDYHEYMIRIGISRVLAECEAKRTIAHRHFGPHECPANPVHTYYRNDLGCPTLRDLATVYADHPDYRQEWRP